MRDGGIPGATLGGRFQHAAVGVLRGLGHGLLEGGMGAPVIREFLARGEARAQMQMPVPHRVMVQMRPDEGCQRILIRLVQPGGAEVERRAQRRGRMRPPADAPACLQHHAASARPQQRPCGGDARAARADDEDVWIIAVHRRIIG